MNTKYKIGVDEAGRGPWFGPVVAAAFCFNPKNPPNKKFLSKLNDSKKLSSKKREEIFEEIIGFSQTYPRVSSLASQFTLSLEKSEQNEPQVYFGVGVVDNFYIDEHNIRQATQEAMRRALIELIRKIGGGQEAIDGILIDGKDNFVFEGINRKPIYIIAGDAKVPEISAASIIAKVFRDKLTKTYAELYPHLELEKHKGYGTKAHSDKLQKPTDITGAHRFSYKPIKAVLESKPKLLLHVCCGPDATIPIVDLKKDYEVIGFWYDPNIQPKREYDKRLEAFIKVCEIEDIQWIEGEYDVKNFFERIKGLEHTPERGEKCTECYDMRLERTARLARELDIVYWTSTLNTSPHKDLEKMFELGEKWSTSPLEKGGRGITQDTIPQSFGHLPLSREQNQKLEFLKIAFRKNNGFLRSVEYTKKHKIYRQDYCGCVYSDTFPGSPKREKIMKKGGYSGG